MKTITSYQTIISIVAVALIAAFAMPEANANSAYGKAAGKYTGTLKGSVSVGGLSIPATPTTVKLPRAKGRVVVNIQAIGTVRGKVKKAKCVQGGKKVIQTGTVKVPASRTGGIGTLVGPFRSVVKLGAGKPTVRARTGITAFGFKVTGVFTGSK